MTGPQQQALVALYLLQEHMPRVAFSRLEIANVSRGDNGSYPLKTMKALWRQGMVAPVNEAAVRLVDSDRCRCGCDDWRITDEGWTYASKCRIANVEKTVKRIKNKADIEMLT